MKIIFSCLGLLLFSSCFDARNNNSEIDRLNQRITVLEQRIDSLISDRNANPIGLNNITSSNKTSYSTPRGTGRCQAMTKKGTQCKRKGKNNGYCWQHGG